jgi:transcriptional regulator with XRE-family HTH domain
MIFFEVVKTIRSELHYSQEQLARDLSISFTTISRWENGRSLQSQLAKNALLERCAAKNVSDSIMKALNNPKIYVLKDREETE